MAIDLSNTSSPKVLINGQTDATLHSSDRGLTYGDGVFETIQIHNARPLLWNAHLQRMRAGALRLKILFDHNTVRAFAEDFQLLKTDFPFNAVLKLTVTRGVGQRGYRVDPQASTTRISTLSTFADRCEQQKNGVVVRLCQTQLARQPQLAGIKHLNRLEQVLARNEWHDPNIGEGIVCDTQGYVIEGCMSNLFWVANGVLYTPSLRYAGVEGVIRNAIIAICREQQQIKIEEGDYEISALASADEIFICNSLSNIVPVIQIVAEDQRIQTKRLSIGTLTKKLQTLLQEYYLRKDEC